MKSEDESSKDGSHATTATKATSTLHVMKTPAPAGAEAAATVGPLPSVSFTAAVATGHSNKVHANLETASAKAKCNLHRPRKLPELDPKEALIDYRINLKKKLLEATVADVKVKEYENTNLKQLIEKLQKEQAEIIRTVMTVKEEEKRALSKEPAYTRDHVIRLRQQNWSKQKQQERTLQKLTESIAKADKDIETRKQEIEKWKSYKDKGLLQHNHEIRLLQKEMDDMEKYFEQVKAQLEQDRLRSLEESERVTEEDIEQSQYLAIEKAITKMDRYERKDVMENYWLQDEIEIQEHGIDNLLHETEELAQENLTLFNDAKHSRLENFEIRRIMDQFPSAENLCENSTMETDLAKVNLQKYDVFQDKNKYPATSANQRTESSVSTEEGKKVQTEDGRCKAGDEKDNSYLREGPLELQFLKVSGHHLNIQKCKTPTAEEVKALDYDEWPVTRAMLKEFCHNSGRH